MDIAARAYAHTFRIDPIIRSLIDTDIYKLLMLPIIARDYPGSEVELTLSCRTPESGIGTMIDARELQEQLEHARTVRLTRRERIWLAGNSFYGQDRLFGENLLDRLDGYQLPEYEVEHGKDLTIRFRGPYCEVTLWEIPALAIVSELRARSVLKHLGRLELDVLYARAKARVWEKIERLRRIENLRIADFGTRRRHSFLWQRWCIEAMIEGLGDRFIGTSNLLHAMHCDLEAIGTNAHELPMVQAALSKTPEDLRQSRYEVLRSWESAYRGNLLVFLPDTYGTSSFLDDAPPWVAGWTGARVDSKAPVEAGRELIEWWRTQGHDPRDKLIIFSDGLDVETIEHIADELSGKVRIGYGWGTNLTNDFAGCATRAVRGLEAVSLVCKVTGVNGRAAVKLSDNPDKATGPEDAIEEYRKVFGTRGMRPSAVCV